MALRLKANRKYPSIPVVVDDPKNHTQVLMAVKEALDIGQRRTADLFNSFIRVEDLIDLGLITIEGNTNAIVGADLSEIADIGDLSGAAAGDFLRFDGSEWINDQLGLADITQAMVTQHQAALSIAYSQLTGTPTIPVNLDDLADVDTPAPADGDVLTWNDASNEWIAAAPTGGGGGATNLIDLDDVYVTYPRSGDVLTWDGYFWTNMAPNVADQPIVLGYRVFAADAGSWGNFTMISGFYGKRMLRRCNSWKMRFYVTVGGLIINKMIACRTLSGSTTILDRVNIKINGQSALTLPAGTYDTDPIGYATDTDHDYYVFIYFDSTTPSTAKVKTGADSGATSLSGDTANDQTGASTVPITPGTGAAYGAPDFYVVN